MNPHYRLPLASLTAVAIAWAASGCGRALSTSPEAVSAQTTSVVRAPDATAVASAATAGANSPITLPDVTLPLPIGPVAKGTILEDPNGLISSIDFVQDPSRQDLPGPLLFLPTAVSVVMPGLETNVSSGRWSLDFHSGSLQDLEPISVSQASDGTMRVAFGPDGTHFGQDVDLTINYAGTSVDPASPSYVAGSVPLFFYFDPSGGTWVEMPSVNDVVHKTLHAKLQHFSTYGVGTRAGW